jgi:hypothetical protein
MFITRWIFFFKVYDIKNKYNNGIFERFIEVVFIENRSDSKLKLPTNSKNSYSDPPHSFLCYK